MSFLSAPPSRQSHYGSLMYRLWYSEPPSFRGSRRTTPPPVSPLLGGRDFVRVRTRSGLKLRARLSVNEINGWSVQVKCDQRHPRERVASGRGEGGEKEREGKRSHFNFRLPLGLRREVDRARFFFERWSGWIIRWWDRSTLWNSYVICKVDSVKLYCFKRRIKFRQTLRNFFFEFDSKV